MARVRLGMGLEEFLGVTPRYLALLLEEDGKRRQQEGALGEFMLAQLTALVANFGRGEDSEPSKTADFMPSERAKAPKRRSRKRKLEDMEQERSIWKALAKQGGRYVPAAAQGKLA